jgi:benzoate membrane transport protein
MLRYFNPAHISAGFVAVLVGYTSSAAIIFQALQSLGADKAVADSWFLVLGIGMGVSCIGLSLFYRQPILTAWSTPGAAIMVTGLSGMSIEAAVGAFIFSSALILLTGITGIFDRLVKLIPGNIAAALLAGVLLPFALNALASLEDNLILGVVMIGSFLVGLRWLPRYSVLITLIAGLIVVAGQMPDLAAGLDLQLAKPVWVSPSFEMSALISLGIPLFIVTMASQNLPGIAALRTANYDAPASPIISSTGIIGLITAPMGGFAYNLAAITAAICMTEEVDKDPKQRFRASVWAGIFYFLVGIFAASITSLFFAVPKAFILLIAGLALLGTIANSLNIALAEEKQRLAPTLTFITTASGVSIFGIGSAFWALVLGLAMHFFMSRRS